MALVGGAGERAVESWRLIYSGLIDSLDIGTINRYVAITWPRVITEANWERRAATRAARVTNADATPGECMRACSVLFSICGGRINTRFPSATPVNSIKINSKNATNIGKTTLLVR